MQINLMGRLYDPITKQALQYSENKYITFYSIFVTIMREIHSDNSEEQNLYDKLLSSVKKYNEDKEKDKNNDILKVEKDIEEELLISLTVKDIEIIEKWFYKMQIKSFIVKAFSNLVNKE